MNIEKKQVIFLVSVAFFAANTAKADIVTSSSIGRYETSVMGGHTDMQTAIRSSRYSSSSDGSYVSGKVRSFDGITMASSSDGGNAVVFMRPGTGLGSAYIAIDTANGILKAKCSAYNYGGPLAYENSSGGTSNYSEYQTWGSSLATASTRRVYQITGDASFDILLQTYANGHLSSDIGAIAQFKAASVVTLVKDADAFFADEELGKALSWSMIYDGLLADWYPEGVGPYDFMFGEGQEVASLLASTATVDDSDSRYGESDFSVITDYDDGFTVSPGDLIVLDDVIYVQTYVFNPMYDVRTYSLSNPPELLLADVDSDPTLTSNLIVQEGFEQNLVGYDFYDIYRPWVLNVDLNEDFSNNLVDFTLFISQYGNHDCDESNGWCQGADYYHTGNVNFMDLMFLAENWLVEF